MRLLKGGRKHGSLVKWFTTSDSQSGDAGSIPAGATIYDPLAQLAEHLTFNQGAGVRASDGSPNMAR